MYSLVFVLGQCWPRAAMRKVMVQGEELHHWQLGKKTTSAHLSENKLQLEVWGIMSFMVGFFTEEVKLQK